MTKHDDNKPGAPEDPFGAGPFGEAQDAGAVEERPRGLLEDLRETGEAVVNEEIAGLQAAMERIESFGAVVADADVDALKTEWRHIESELKRALHSGLAAAEENKARHQSTVDEEIRALETEVARKNDLIAQLSDTLKGLNRELDDRDRKLRDEVRSLRDRTVEQDEDLARLRSRTSEADSAQARTRSQLDMVTAERDALRRSSAAAAEALEVEKAHQEERYASLQAELNETRTASAKLEHDRRDVDRRAGDLERRLAAAEKAREKVEHERAEHEQEAARAHQENKALSERLATVEAELAVQRERIDKDLRRLRRVESRLRADAETYRSRVTDVAAALGTALETLKSLPKELPPDEEGAKPPAEG